MQATPAATAGLLPRAGIAVLLNIPLAASMRMFTKFDDRMRAVNASGGECQKKNALFLRKLLEESQKLLISLLLRDNV
ncbi:MAG: hypothetical protein LBJ67_02555 [Planctomycetaceae bacterium]|nr:hypothetical protein [Planctomycetaceae bacterium]